jgi:hypothetical protein
MSIGKPMTRKEALNAIRAAGYHDNIRHYLHILDDSKIDKPTADKAWNEGRNANMKGMPCTCMQCGLNNLQARFA